MFINEKFIYLSLSKTGCTYTEKVLSRLLSGTRTNGRHKRLGEVSKEYTGDFASKLKVGNVRNPWDWYVSLWAWGCLGKGSLYRNLINQREGKYLNRLYSDVNNPVLFREWLSVILTDDNVSKMNPKDNSPPIFEFAGLFTFRYIKQYTQVSRDAIAKLRNYDQLRQLDQKENFIDIFMKTETLDSDLVQLLQKIEAPPATLDKYYLIRDNVKRNNSIRRSYHYYYDGYWKNMVGDRDRYIVERHGYEF